jgi:PHP family Zn ribbon phosphoesterase
MGLAVNSVKQDMHEIRNFKLYISVIIINRMKILNYNVGNKPSKYHGTICHKCKGMF